MTGSDPAPPERPALADGGPAAPTTDRPSDLSPGQTLDRRYELVRLLGRGAMGSVYLARQVWLDRPVAVKVLNPDLPVDARARRRLHREARAVGRISHPNVVQVHDYGQTREGAPYLVMEYVKGRSPEDVLAHAELPDVVAAIDGVLAGLGAAHDRGVLHRDLKPANMMLRGDDPGAVVLLDFGIAAILGADDPRWSVGLQPPTDDERITRDGAVMGTPLYMSPEQARGREVTERSDLYSVGVILYHWLAGHPPFTGRVRQVMRAHVFEPLPPLTPRSGLMIPGPLVRVLERVMEKHPARRYGSAAEMRQAIRDAMAADPLAPGSPPRTPLDPAPVTPTLQQPAPVLSLTAPTGARLMAEPPFVDREEPAEHLRGLLDAASAGRGSIVLVEGPDGVGKSRLVQQVLADGARAGRLLQGRAVAPPGGGPPLQLARAAMSDLLRCRSLSPSGLLDRLTDALGGGEGALSAEERGRLAAWLRGGASTGAPVRPQTPLEWQEQALVERALRVLSSRATPVLWLDDLQWSDPATSAFLVRLAITLSLDPFGLLVVVTRAPSAGPAPDDALVRYLGRSVHRLELPPLSLAATEQLLGGLLPLDVSTATRLASRADGSPLHAVELIRHLMDRGLLRQRDQLWTLTDEQGPGALLPASLEQVLSDRLEAALSESVDVEGTQRLLEAAAVLGQAFEVALLERVLAASGSPLDPDLLDDLLDALVSVGLFDEPGGLSDRLRWGHPMLRDLTLARMGRSRRRRRVCRAAADALLASSDVGDRVARPVVELLLLAGDRTAAGRHAVDAGEEALEAGDMPEAIRFFELARSADDPALRRKALWGLGSAENHLGHTDRAEQCYRAILAADPDPFEQGWAWSGIGRCRYSSGDHQGALQALGKALDLLDPPADPSTAVGRSRTLRTLAAVAAELPGVPVPDPDVEALLALAERPEERCEHLTTAGYLALRRGDLDAAVRWFEQALDEARRSGGYPGLPNLLADLGRACRASGDERAAERYLEEGLRLARRNGQHRVEANLHNERGELARSRGDLRAAATEYRAAVSLWRLLGSRHQLLGSLNLALVAAQDARPEEALEVLSTLQDQEPSPPYQAALLLTRALALAAAGRHDEAVAPMERGSSIQARLAPPHDEAVGVLRSLAALWRSERPELADRAAGLGRRLIDG